MLPALCQEALPRVHLLATGGTIAGGSGGSLTGADLVQLIPELARTATVAVEDFVRIGSSRMTPEIQFRLARRVQELFAKDGELAGVVITHGTDSLEETAFLLDLLLASDRPVVFAAAQRPPRERDSDGPRNLAAAIRIAASKQARGLGVLLTLNDEIHAAGNARKTHTIALDAFVSPRLGPVGFVDTGRVLIHRRPARRLTIETGAIESRVDLVTLVAGDDGHLLQAAAAHGARAVVVEVFGRGNVPPAVMEVVGQLRDKEVVVVFTSRTRGGRVEIDEAARRLGVVSGEDLDGLKARMLLIAALGKTQDPVILQRYFERLSGVAEQP